MDTFPASLSEFVALSLSNFLERDEGRDMRCDVSFNGAILSSASFSDNDSNARTLADSSASSDDACTTVS